MRMIESKKIKDKVSIASMLKKKKMLSVNQTFAQLRMPGENA